MQFNINLDMGKKDKRTITITAPNAIDAEHWGQRQLLQWKKNGKVNVEAIVKTETVEE